MVKLARAFSRLRPIRALVLGDLMLDTYLTGRVKRISPEAPVPVMEVKGEESRAGGAGNVMLSLSALGAEVRGMGRIGSDGEGKILLDALRASSIVTDAILEEPGYKTTLKRRLIADSQQLLRVDYEQISPLDPSLEEELLKRLSSYLDGVDVIALSDYGKGFLTPRLIQTVLAEGKKRSIPTIVDPKGLDFSRYRGASLLKPNLSEAYAAAKLASSASLEEVAAVLLPITEVESLIITRSEAGITIFDAGGRRIDCPVHSREVKDVTGAGDTVLATLCLAIASKLDIEAATHLANVAAGLSIERIGCVQVSLSEIAGRLLRSDSKRFEESESGTLGQLLKGRPFSLLLLDDQPMTHALYRSLRSLAHEQSLLLYLEKANDDFIDLLSSFSEVDSILIGRENLEALCKSLPPTSVYAFREGALSQGKEKLKELLEQSSRPRDKGLLDKTQPPAQG
jgi:D-beta-D-heptose 7-phosphate kinase/D-beta-D-heptose 1-phosphate adenosyltransferase